MTDAFIEAQKKLIASTGVKIETEKVYVNGLEIHYTKCGQGANLLLLHGANMGWGQWYPNLAELSKNFTVYALDLPGAGGSTKILPQNKDYHEILFNSVKNFLKIKQINKTHILGHSVGAWIAIKLALEEPNKVEKLVLVSPLGFSKRTPIKYKLIGIRPIAKLLAKTVMKMNKKNASKFINSVFFDPTKVTDEFHEYYLHSLDPNPELHPFMFINRLSGFKNVRKEFVLLNNELEKISQPTLIVVGDKDPIITYNKEHLSAFKTIPGCKLEVFYDVGHVPPFEKYKKFNGLVTKFLI